MTPTQIYEKHLCAFKGSLWLGGKVRQKVGSLRAP